jgi:hypothetical protein
MKNSDYPIENRTRDLPTCSTVPQPTAPRHRRFGTTNRSHFQGIKSPRRKGPLTLEDGTHIFS